MTTEPGRTSAQELSVADTVPHLSCRLEAMIVEGLRLKGLAQMRRATKLQPLATKFQEATHAREATITP